MPRPRKEKARAKGIYPKKGHLYVALSRPVQEDGKKKYKREWYPTGLADEPENIEKAKRIREQLLADVHGEERIVDVESYARVYLKRKKRIVADTTYSKAFYDCKRITDFFKGERLRRITVDRVEEFLDYMLVEKKLSERTLRDTKQTFAALMDAAVKDGIINNNPVKEAQISQLLLRSNASARDPDEEFFSFDEAMQFLKAAKEHPLYELFYLTLFFGLRLEEVNGLKWSAIDLEKREMTINHTVTLGTKINRENATKTAGSRDVFPLAQDQVDLFYRLKEREDENRRLFKRSYVENDYIFKHPDGSNYYPQYPSRVFHSIIRKNPSLPQKITFHGLRRSCASILVHERYDVKTVQKWMRHRDITTTLNIYARVKDQESKKEISEGLSVKFNV